MLEKLLHSRIYKFLLNQNILYDNQYGFRSKSSTSIAATEIIQKMQKYVDEGKISCAVFLDISKAFDTVKHDILMKKLELYGIRGQTLSMIRNYFQNRTQYITMKEYSSEMMYLNYGVIQGGVLAALLFVIYINDIGILRLHGKIFTYADDTAIVYDHQNIQQDLKIIADFFRINVLSINASKTNYMIIHSP